MFKLKKVGVFAFAAASMLFVPSNVSAAVQLNVDIKTGASGQETTIATIEGVYGTTTIGDIKEVLTNDHNIDFNDYALVSGSFDVYNDSFVLCDAPMTCGGMETKTTYIQLAQIDHTKKEYTLKSIPATDENMFESFYETNYEMFGNLYPKTCNNTFTKCTFADTLELKLYDNVVINYSYDSSIKELAQAIVDAGLLNKTKFTLTDTEFLHYINYGGFLANYSGEFKNQLSNLNFKFEMDVRGGGDEPFETGQIGFYKFIYGDTMYAVKEFMEVSVDHIIYVPTDTTNIKEAIESRLTAIFGSNNHITVRESEHNINEYLTSLGLDTIENGNQHYYILTVSNENSPTDGMEFRFIPIKDSSKINNNVTFKSSDLTTNVSVSTDSQIPVDTLISVLGLTSGTEYEKIMKLLKLTDAEMFDISLYSSAQDKYVEKLDNGKFLVSIPVSKKFEGKTLIVYYVDEDDKVKTYNVTVKDGYAIFETDHFRIYTLAVDGVKNPKTGDNILLYVATLMISSSYLLTRKLRKN